eukprot:gene4352-8662_t
MNSPIRRSRSSARYSNYRRQSPDRISTLEITRTQSPSRNRNSTVETTRTQSPSRRTHSSSWQSYQPRQNLDMDAALESVKRKLRHASVKVDTVVQRCEEIDRNKDGIIHPDDLVDILNESLPLNSLSRREKRYLTSSLSHSRKSVSLDYKMLGRVLDDDYDNRFDRTEIQPERWTDNIDHYEERYPAPTGSIGEFLQKAACPSEQRNYAKFVNCLEKFERETGMKIMTHSDGFLVPLGPDLRASVQIFLA